MRRGISTAVAVLSLLAGWLSAGRAQEQDVVPDCLNGSPFGNSPRPVVNTSLPGQDNTKPSCTGGTLLGPRADADGNPRWACLYAPIPLPSHPLPLVVYIHPSLYTADTLGVTNLPEMVSSANVSDDPSQPGFLLLAPEGRSTTHFYAVPDDQGTGWDNWYRQLDPSGHTVTVNGVDYPENVDAATIDDFVRYTEDNFAVNQDRVYLTGWSNGSAMAYLYGLSRPNIAAIAVFSAPDPLHAFNDPCPQIAVHHKDPQSVADNGKVKIFNRGLPTMHVHNDCDIAGLCPNGERMGRNLSKQGIFVQDTIINSAMLPANGCLATCGTDENADASPLSTSAHPLTGDSSVVESAAGVTLGTLNHTRWPQGWTIPMLDFFRTHPRSGRP